MNKQYKSKSSKTKVTDLHYVSDKNHSDSKYAKKEKMMYINYSLVMFKCWKLNAPI